MKFFLLKKAYPINNGKRLVTIEVIPLLNTIDLHFLILFKDTPPTINKTEAGKDKLQSAGLKKMKKIFAFNN